MTKFAPMLWIVLLAAALASGQSLKPDEPFPLNEGLNRATADSLVGTQYWYFYAAPGSNRVVVRMKRPATLYGAEMRTVLTVTLSDAARTWRTTKQLVASPNGAEVVFTADKILKQQTVVIAVAPPNQNMLRLGGDYEIEVTGSVMFNGETAEGDPIVRTYDSKMNNYGATRFLADGTVVASDGTRGTWKLFDPDTRIYSITIGQFRFSARYRAGYGLVRPAEPDMIIFQEIRR